MSRSNRLLGTTGSNSVGQFEQIVVAGLGIPVAGNIRGGTAEHQCRSSDLRYMLGDGSGVVSRWLVALLVGPFMLFVDDDEAKVFYRRKDRPT
jgi:hypothetical protein